MSLAGERSRALRVALLGFVSEAPSLLAALKRIGAQVVAPHEARCAELNIHDLRGDASRLASVQGGEGGEVRIAYASDVSLPFDGFDDVLPESAAGPEIERRLSLCARLALAREGELKSERQEELTVANGSLRFAVRRFESLFQGLPVACFSLDADGVIHEWNQAATRLFGIETFLAMFQTAEDVFGAEWTLDALRGRTEGEAFEWSWTRADGQTLTMECRLLPIVAADGRTTAIVATNLDMTARIAAQTRVQALARRAEAQAKRLARANGELASRALTDSLTGLGNRRSFDAALEQALDRRRRSGFGFSLLLLDLDRFKAINDDFGHHAGDEILRRAAAVLRRSTRRFEAPMRIGGEEFALLIESDEPEKVARVAERIRRGMAEHEWPFRTITASIGIAACCERDSVETLFARADAALYRAKEAGRDRYLVAA